MDFPRFKRSFVTALVLTLAMFALVLPVAHAATCPPCPDCATLTVNCADTGSNPAPQAATGPTFSGVLNLGAATAAPEYLTRSSSMTCPMVELKVNVANIGPFNFNGEVRHAICNADKGELYGKSRYCAGLEVPAGPNAFLFANYERYYRTGDDWAWAGVSFRFGP